MIFGKKEREVEKLVVKFFLEVKKTLPELAKTLQDYMSSDKHFKEEAYRVHVHEHEADNIRRQIMVKLYEGAFLPFFREDYLLLIALGDGIANLAEAVASFIVLTRPRIPDFLEAPLREMMAATIEAYQPMEGMLGSCQNDACADVPGLAKTVEQSEQKVDRLQWDIIKTTFKSDLSLAEKLHLKELIDTLASISDQIEDVADRFEIMLVKRPV